MAVVVFPVPAQARPLVGMDWEMAFDKASCSGVIPLAPAEELLVALCLDVGMFRLEFSS